MNIGDTVECVNPIMGLSVTKLYRVTSVVDNVVRIETMEGEDCGYYSDHRFCVK